jgi:IS5 family transposase
VVDTTVQEKAITQPIDARLTHRAIEKLVAAKREGVELRQSYLRVAKRAASVQDSVIPKLTDASQ